MNADLPTVAEVVAKLQTKASADHLAVFFQAQQVRGEIAESRSCPVANYITRETGQLVSVGKNVILPLCNNVAGERAQRVLLNIKGPIPEFIGHFDHGRYPELVAK